MDEFANDLSCAMIGVEVNECDSIANRAKSDEETSPHKDAFVVLSKTNEKQLHSANNSASSVNLILNAGNKVKKSSSQKSAQKKSNKPVARSASILLRSKVLVLSDSDSEEFDANGIGNEEDRLRLTTGLVYNCLSLTRKSRMKKHKRKKDEKEHKFSQLSISQSNYNQYYGKRKRSTSLFANGVDEGAHSNDATSSAFNQHQSMDCDDSSAESSSLSESECETDHFVEADDEQSDFYEVMSRTSEDPSTRTTLKCTSKSKYYHSIPIPRNPFASVPTTPSSSFNSLNSSSTSILWKRRRRNH
ncbi:hypothetical protein B4U79_03188 [Dinothrombium tinctorium]|uniref:Uncharacterized protein n=1 Tax=Dinothrombium tinctorium TaxID=1965070 RepID=A0A443QW85_9ACAR|nr:hypothetical protein B4U79_03188 [Dinothrombium tinctorium]